MAKLPTKNDLRRINDELGDITGKLDRISTLGDAWVATVVKNVATQKDLAREIDAVVGSAGGLHQLTIKQRLVVNKMQGDIDALGSKWTNVGKIVGGKVVNSFDRLGKSIINVGLDVLEKSLHDVGAGIERVYELQERWAHLMGNFRNSLGVTTKNIGSLSKVAAEVEGTIYGLTNSFGQGAPMVTEFVEGLGRIEDVADPKNLRDLIKTGIFAGRVLGISAGDAGQLSHALQQLGEDTVEQKDLFLDISAGSKAAGVSTAEFGKELVQSRGFLTSFGSTGRKMFMEMATYAKRLGVSLKSLEAFTKMTDTFDSTATSVSKLNTVFGTTINSLDLMLEQDPSKRLETVRQALLSQGKTYQMLSRQERMFLGDTMNLSQEELAGVLKTGKTLDQVRGDQEKARIDQEKAQANMAKLINKTSTTLFAFRAAWDQVTVAITKLIKPFTDAIGLTAEFDKNGKRVNATFGQVMSASFKRLIRFIEEVAANPDWQTLMRGWADDAKSFFKTISDVATGPRLGSWIKTITRAVGDFYDIAKVAFRTIVETGQKAMPVLAFVLRHVKEILAVWGGMKLGVGAASLVGRGAGFLDTVGLLGHGKGSPGKKAMQSFGGALGTAAAAGGGALAGYAGGDTGLGKGAGAIAGALAGILIPGFGKILAPVIGYAVAKIGDWIEKMSESPTTKLIRQREEALADAHQRLIDQEDALTLQERRTSVERRAIEIGDQARKFQRDDDDRRLGDTLARQKQGSIRLNSDEIELIRKRLSDMATFGVRSQLVSAGLLQLSRDGTISTKALQELATRSSEYEKIVDQLASDSDRLAEAVRRQIELQSKVQIDRVQNQIDQADLDLKQVQKDEAKARAAADAAGDLAKSYETFDRVASQLNVGAVSPDILMRRQKAIATQAVADALTIKRQGLESTRNTLEQQQIDLRKKFNTQLDAANQLELIQRDETYKILQQHVGQTYTGMSLAAQQRKALELYRAAGFSVPQEIFQLPELGRVQGQTPSTVGGSAAAPGAVQNYAPGPKTAMNGGPTVLRAGDVYLDGRKVGRHIVREMLSDQQGAV